MSGREQGVIYDYKHLFPHPNPLLCPLSLGTPKGRGNKNASRVDVYFVFKATKLEEVNTMQSQYLAKIS